MPALACTLLPRLEYRTELVWPLAWAGLVCMGALNGKIVGAKKKKAAAQWG